MKIMGIDPGTQSVGYGILEVVGNKTRPLDYGSIQSHDKMIHKRLDTIFKGLLRVARHHHPEWVVVEKAFYARNVSSTLRMGEGRGIALLCAAQTKANVAEYSPNEVKSAVSGVGHASKSQVQFMVKTILGLKDIPEPNDAADALAIAICHANRIHPAKGL